MIVPQQEFHIDHILAYTIQAGEILTNEIKLTDSKYRFLFMPHGPELYTWPLKSAGYLLLNQKIEHLILLYIQDQYPNKITVFEDSEWLIALWKEFIVINPNIEWSQVTHEIDPDILLQFNFLSIIKPINKISVIGIGKQTNQMEVFSEIKKICTNKKIWCIMYDSCSKHVSRDQARTTDEIALSNSVEKKEGTLIHKPRLANIFVKLLNKSSRPRLLWYVNSGDFGWSQDDTTSYACMVG